MADWSTVAIAGIAALAGLGGSIITGAFAVGASARTQKRDDAALLRNQVEALFEELDALHQASQRNTIVAMELANGVHGDKVMDGYDLGRVKAIISLYFPDLQVTLDTLREREVAATAALRAGLQDNPLAAGGQFGLEQSVYVATFCNEAREALAQKAREVGASVRASVK